MATFREDSKAPLFLITQHRETIYQVSKTTGVSAQAIATVIFNEKFHGIWATLKNELAYIVDFGVNDESPATRSYGLAEMQLRLAAQLLNMDIEQPGTKKKVYDLLQNNGISILLIAKNILRNENIIGQKLDPVLAGYAHNNGPERVKRYLEGKSVLIRDIASRSEIFQLAIRKALEGEIDTRTDKEIAKELQICIPDLSPPQK